MQNAAEAFHKHTIKKWRTDWVPANKRESVNWIHTCRIYFYPFIRNEIAIGRSQSAILILCVVSIWDSLLAEFFLRLSPVSLDIDFRIHVRKNYLQDVMFFCFNINLLENLTILMYFDVLEDYIFIPFLIS